MFAVVRVGNFKLKKLSWDKISSKSAEKPLHFVDSTYILS